MATKKNTALRAKAARRAVTPKRERKYIVPEGVLMHAFGFDSDKDRAVMAWQKWASIRDELNLAERTDSDSKGYDRRIRRLCDRDWEAGEEVLKAKVATLSGVAAKLHVAPVLSDGFDEQRITDMIRKTLDGVTGLIQGELREKIVSHLVEMERSAAS